MEKLVLEKGIEVRGVGVVGVWHVHAADYVDEILQREDAQILSVWDSDYKAAAAFAHPRGLRVVRGLEELLDDDAVEAVIVDTATSDHVEVISQALQAGKHVFTEKVLAILPEDAVRLESLALRLNRALVVSFQRLAEPWVPTLKGVIDSGVLGKITSSRIRYQHAGAVEGWLHDGFFSPSQAGGGALIDLGVHGIYLSQLFHGSYPTTVTCKLSDITGRGVEDNSVVIFEYGDGALSVLETSLSSAPNDARWAEVHGTHGVAVVDSREGTLYVKLSGGEWAAQEMHQAGQSPVDHFFSVIDDGADYEQNRFESIRLVSLVAASYKSAREWRTVSVGDPVNR
jgi:1,5-anhydro-D-fructose reductase (1,5-anhydro-D-mannitol-forming)